MEFIMPNIESILSGISDGDLKQARYSTIKMAITNPGKPRPPLRMIAFDNDKNDK